jgi:hypothetical protein
MIDPKAVALYYDSGIRLVDFHVRNGDLKALAAYGKALAEVASGKSTGKIPNVTVLILEYARDEYAKATKR